jgi:hypothetical protein
LGAIVGILRIPEDGINLAAKQSYSEPTRKLIYFCVMNQSKRLLRARKLVLIALFIASFLAMLGGTGAPDGTCLPPPFDGDLLQIMPWPIYHNMTDRDLRAIYEYLSAIPCITGPSAPSPLHNDCE